jgi:hypothetical protein
MTKYAYERIEAGLPCSGVLVVRTRAVVGETVEALAMIAGASEVNEWEGKVTFLPLR